MIRHEKSTMTSGLRIVTQSMPNAESVAISISIKAGSRDENIDEHGVAHFLEHMLFKGTKNRPSPLLVTSPIESTGGSLNASTGYESTTYWCHIPKNDFSIGISILLDMIQNPLLQEHDIDSERSVVIEEIKSIEDYPDSKAALNLDELMWGCTALGRDIAGSVQSIQDMNQIKITNFMDQLYAPANIVISISGNVSHEAALEAIENSFIGKYSKNKPTRYDNIKVSKISPQITLEHREIEQVHIHIGYHGVSRSHPDRYALAMLSLILGDGMSSRLFQEIRERRGLVYDIESGTSHLQDVGDFRITLAVHRDKYVEAIKSILEEIEAVKRDLGNPEVTRAKQIMSGRRRLRMDNTQSVASWNAQQELFNNHIDSENLIKKLIERNNQTNLQRVATEYLNMSNLNLSVVGDIDCNEAILDKITEI